MSIKINVNKETIDYLQKLHFEKEARADVIQRIIEAHAMDEDYSTIESAVFKKYQEELSECTASYELAKQEMAEIYIPGELLEKGVPWNLDFRSGILTINGAVDEKK